ncbi:MAG: hypothetical protein H6Q15_415 [Bacteroidetes bacterium]|nr:hypothetical protein [Bacteroidota bacterium]
MIYIMIGCCNNINKQKDYIQNADCFDCILSKKGKRERNRQIKEKGLFNYLYRYDFAHRWSDKFYLLCYFSSIERVDNTAEIKKIYGCNDSTRVVLLKIKPLESYETPENIWPPLIADTLLTIEYLKIQDLGCAKILKDLRKRYYDIPQTRYAYLLIQEHEIGKIQNDIASAKLNLLEYDTFSSIDMIYNLKYFFGDTICSTNYFPYGEYDLSKLESSELLFRRYDSIDRAVRKRLNINIDSTCKDNKK